MVSNYVPGFSNPSLAGLLHSLGPDTASSNEHMVDSIIERCHYGYQENYHGDSSIIVSPPVSVEEKAKLLEVRGCVRTSAYTTYTYTAVCMTTINFYKLHTCTHTHTKTPLLSYSAYDPHRVFLTSHKVLKDDEPALEISHIHQLQWVVTANAVTRPQLLDMIQMVVGIEQLVYLYAKVGVVC